MNTSLFAQRLETVKVRALEFGQIFAEIFKGFKREDEKLYRAIQASVAIGFLIIFEGDVWLFQRLHLWKIYPTDGWMFKTYAGVMLCLPILAFGVIRRENKRRFRKELREVFDIVGLKNAIGSYPNFLSLEPVIGATMLLKITNGGFPLDDWRKKKERLEACLRVFIDSIEQVQEKGIIEIIFSFEPMPKKVVLDNIFRFGHYQYLMGRDRLRGYLGCFGESPHLLIGGETGGGKSAFMRQLVTTIKANQAEAEFHLLDLKGGAEFGYFEHFPGMNVILETKSFAPVLAKLKGEISRRAEGLRARRLTKIEEFFGTTEFKGMTTEERTKHLLGRRIFIVVDECAEVFLFNHGRDPAPTREIRSCMSSITRLGRFVGIHVILGTQRPDKQAIDPQVKSNLTTTICFRIHDHGGSLTILGNGKATGLPKLPGRAILQHGSEEVEVQTPLLTVAESIKVLEAKFKMIPEIEVVKGGKINAEKSEESAKEAAQPDSLK